MPLEDHILNTVRTLRSAGESLLDIAKKVGEEIVKDKPTPEGAAAQPANEEAIPGWDTAEAFQISEKGLFRFRGHTYQREYFKGDAKDADGNDIELCRARCLDTASDRFVLFHPHCKVLAKKN